jgi:hypothetical protein
MDLPRAVRALGLVVAGVTAVAALWVAVWAPATLTMAPASMEVP